MKKKSIVFIIIGIILVAVIAVVCCLSMDKTLYTLNLPQNVDNYSSITLEQNGGSRTIETTENMQNIITKLVGTERTTYEESIQDAPAGMEEKMTITFNSEKIYTLFVYKKKDKYYIEQPYNGVYEITQDEYDDINKFYQELRVEVTNMEKTSLTNRVEKLDAVDQLGRSFKAADLTNDELLRLGFSLFGPVKNFGFTNITFEDLSRTYIKGFFGREDAEPKDIICSCGKVISTYNSSNDTFTWNQEFHYLEHKSDTYNEIKDMYKIEDKYIVEVYKIFPDLLKNSSISQYNFYSTYNDAANQQNALFSVANEDEFTSALESLDDSQKVLYTLTFERNGTFKLVNYKIENNF